MGFIFGLLTVFWSFGFPAYIELEGEVAQSSQRQSPQEHIRCEKNYNEAYLHCDPNNSAELRRGSDSMAQIIRSISSHLGAQNICGQMSDIFNVALGSMDLYAISCNELRKNCLSSCAEQTRRLEPVLKSYVNLCGTGTSQVRIAVDRMLRTIGDVSQLPYAQSEFQRLLAKVPKQREELKLPGAGGFQVWKPTATSIMLKSTSMNQNVHIAGQDIVQAAQFPSLALALHQKLSALDRFLEGCEGEFARIKKAREKQIDIAKQCRGFEEEVRTAAKTMNEYMGSQATASRCQKQLSVARNESCAETPNSPLCSSVEQPTTLAGKTPESVAKRLKGPVGIERRRPRQMASTVDAKKYNGEPLGRPTEQVDEFEVEQHQDKETEPLSYRDSFHSSSTRQWQKDRPYDSSVVDSETAGAETTPIKPSFSMKQRGRYRLPPSRRKSSNPLRDYLPGGTKDPKKPKSSISGATGPSNFDKISGKYRDKLDTLIPEKVND